MSQFTKTAIIQTFMELLDETTFDKITVTDIVARCGINRNTFYYYFQDIYQLVDELFEIETQKILSSNITYENWSEGFILAISFTKNKRKAIHHLFNSACRNRLEDYLHNISRRTIIDYLQSISKDLNVTVDDIEDLAYFYAFALVGVFTDWMKNDMNYDLEGYIWRMHDMLVGNTRATLENVSKKNRGF